MPRHPLLQGFEQVRQFVLFTRKHIFEFLVRFGQNLRFIFGYLRESIMDHEAHIEMNRTTVLIPRHGGTLEMYMAVSGLMLLSRCFTILLQPDGCTNWMYPNTPWEPGRAGQHPRRLVFCVYLVCLDLSNLSTRRSTVGDIHRTLPYVRGQFYAACLST